MKRCVLLLLLFSLPLLTLAEQPEEPRASLKRAESCNDQELMLRYCQPVTDQVLTEQERSELRSDCVVYNCAGRIVASCENREDPNSARAKAICPEMHLF